jgi:hypothetical protein
MLPCEQRIRQDEGEIAIPTDMQVEILQHSLIVSSPSAEIDT